MKAGFRFGLIGHPLGHSYSPVLHQSALEEFGLQGEYPLFPVPPFPEGSEKLESLLRQLRAGLIRGINVTIPHKQNVIPYLDRLSPAARSIGAVNTLTMEDGELVGHNTDADGFRHDLLRVFSLEPAKALVLGAGGSSRAVAYALAQDGWQLAAAARRRPQAETLSEISGAASMETLSFPLVPNEIELWAPALIVNTTPIGMDPEPARSPWPESLPFPEKACVYDLVYNPAETKFLSQARDQGLRTAGGIGMLVEQAALAFEIWTGLIPSREGMSTALLNYLAMRR